MRKYLTLFILGFWSLAFPANAFAATLSIEPSVGSYNIGCTFTLNIKLNTDGAQSDGVDVILLYDPTRMVASSVTKGTLFAEYPGTNIDPTGKISILALASVNTSFSGEGTFAIVTFTIPPGTPQGMTQVTFDYAPGKTTDSNVVERGTTNDILSNVVNGAYTIATGPCSATPAPSPTPTPGGSTTTQNQPRYVYTQPQGATYVVGSTPSGQYQYKTLDQYVDKTGKGPGTPQMTFAIALVGGILTVLGILGLALL